MPLTKGDLAPFQGTDNYRIITLHNLPVRDGKLKSLSLQLLASNWEPFAIDSSYTVSPQPRPYGAQSLDEISVLWKVAQYLKDCHFILSFKRGSNTRWLHFFVIDGEVILKESGEFHWMQEGYFKSRKERQQHISGDK